MMLLFLGLLYCNVSFSGTDLFSVARIQANEGDSICLNVSTVPLFVGFQAIPDDTIIEIRKPFMGNREQTEETITDAQTIPFAFREVRENASFALRASKNESVFSIALITASFCRDGVTFISGEFPSLTFSSMLEHEFQLRPNEEKCVIILNENGTKVTASVRVRDEVDFLYHYHTLSIYERITGNAQRTFSTLGADTPMVLRIRTGQDVCNRSVILTTENSSEDEMKIISYGRGVLTTPLPRPTPEIVWVTNTGMSLIPMISLIVSGVIFVLFGVAVCARYRLLAHCFGIDGSVTPSDKQLMPPSHFVSGSKHLDEDDD